jgi:hypothetical protein
MTTLPISDSLYMSTVQESREADLVWSATHAIQNSDQDTVFKKYYLSRLENWEPQAIELCKKIYADKTDDVIPDWNCCVCGCSDMVDIHGDRICWCDSCSKTGCESSESRVARGCKRRRKIHEIGLAFDALFQLFYMRGTERQSYEAMRQRSELMHMIQDMSPPPSLEAIFDEVQEEIKTNSINPTTLARIYQFICWGDEYTPYYFADLPKDLESMRRS